MPSQRKTAFVGLLFGGSLLLSGCGSQTAVTTTSAASKPVTTTSNAYAVIDQWSVTPRLLPFSGGTVHFTEAVVGAKSCSLSSTATESITVRSSPRPIPCEARMVIPLSIAPNRSGVGETVRWTLTVVGANSIPVSQTTSYIVGAPAPRHSTVTTSPASNTNVFLPSSAFDLAVADAQTVVADFAVSNPDYVQAPKDVQRLVVAFDALYQRGKSALRGTWAGTILTTLNHAASKVSILQKAVNKWAADDYSARVCLYNQANGSATDCTSLIDATNADLGVLIGEFGDAKNAYSFISGAQIDNNTFVSQMG